MYSLGSNPFFHSFLQSDAFGKFIFLFILALSVLSWVIIVYKTRLDRSVRKLSSHFEKTFNQQCSEPLKVQYRYPKSDIPHPFYDLYQVLKKQTLEILAKNRSFSGEKGALLSHSDMELVESQLSSTIACASKTLESSLYLLATVYTLAPFLGLLGTVWGILSTFAELQANYGSASQQVLNGLSLALATTVLGLLAAIPALIGYNYLKNRFREFQTEMEMFATRIVSTVELHYRQVDTIS